ncbi:hypothetical protein [Saccharothrix texasensis]|uniref:Alpha/beta hydrolase family protein n=1 Tax=Saccharothrix texasensis TaxID=103734 RepID=A0A3N1GYR5_9PSEU|nr:hypothetical protein [Saccharothrix texasensis]ROP35246.1 hypothetical protein EDD40_0468 [Saccharothrix texasensis]
MSVALVLVHGLFSSAAVWSHFDRLVGGDPDLADVDVLHFEYASPKVELNSARRIPSVDDSARMLDTYLQLRTERHSSIVLATHSQGGLVVQRYLARKLREGKGLDLARIGHVVLFACPSNGSEFLGALRAFARPVLGNVQEKELRPLVKPVTEALTDVLNRVVNAKGEGPSEYPVPVHAYAGEQDKVVLPQSALSHFPHGGMLPGDHFTIVRPEDRDAMAYLALKRHLLPLVARKAPAAVDLRAALGVGKGGIPRSAVVDSVRGALDAGERLVVLFGLPRSGRTTALCDAVADATAWRSVFAHRARDLDAVGARLFAEAVRAAAAPRLVVLDDVVPGMEAADLARALSLEPDTVVVATSATRPDLDLPAWSIAVDPLSPEEIRALVEEDARVRARPDDVDRVLGLLPPPVSSLPGALRAFLAEGRRTPLELLLDPPWPESVARELRPVADLVAGLDRGDREVLATFAAFAGVPLSVLIGAGLVDRAAVAPGLRRLIDAALVSQVDDAIVVPAVVVSVLVADERRAAAAGVAAAVRTAAGPAGSAVGPDLAAALPVVARTALAAGAFGELAPVLRGGLADRLNRQGYWPEYLAVTGVLIDGLDAEDDRVGAVALRCRLARKVAQQGDSRMAWSLLHEAEQHVGDLDSAEVRATLHSHRAFLANLDGDFGFALSEAGAGLELQRGLEDERGVFVAHKLLGNIHLRRGDHAQAAAHFGAALGCGIPADAPERVEAEISLAWCEVELGRTREATVRLDDVIRRMWSGAHTELPRALHLRALLAEDAGFPAQALDLARRAEAERAREPAVREAVARMVWRMERFGAGGAPAGTPGPEVG